ncbi:MAG: LapA family protein [Proteobacteria bacterium]|nr:MAG: LapA family protein [Pseudomonadota bacterium]
MRIVQSIILFLIFVVALAFAVINADAVKIDYYVGSIEMPLSVIVVVTFALGAIVGLLVSLGRMLGLKRELNQVRRAERISQQELTNLRSMPIRQDH